MNIPFYEFRHKRALRQELDLAYKRVMDRGVFILGPELESLEKEVAEYLGVKYVVGVGSGYDALFIALKTISNHSLKVLLQSNAYHATINAVINSGHQAVFYDCNPKDDHFQEGYEEFALKNGIDIILPVHFFGKGNPAVLRNFNRTAILEDFSQAFGTSINGKLCGSFGRINAASMYPTKNLGAFGDAGIISTNDEDLATQCKELRNYGEQSYYNLTSNGINSRLDELQAAFLRVQLKNLHSTLSEKRKIASFYFENLKAHEDLVLPAEDLVNHTYHQFVIKSPKRNELQSFLNSKGISTKIHYPSSIFDQKAFKALDLSQLRKEPLLKWHNEVLSLPSFPGITEKELAYICLKMNSFFN